MDPDDEGVPPEEWTRGDKRFAAVLAIALAVVLVTLGALILLWNWAAENVA